MTVAISREELINLARIARIARSNYRRYSPRERNAISPRFHRVLIAPLVRLSPIPICTIYAV